jgi:hypothetical protein
MKLSSILYPFIFILSAEAVIYAQKSVAKLSQQETGKDEYLWILSINIITLPTTANRIEEWLLEYKVPAVGIGIIEDTYQLVQVQQ